MIVVGVKTHPSKSNIFPNVCQFRCNGAMLLSLLTVTMILIQPNLVLIDLSCSYFMLSLHLFVVQSKDMYYVINFYCIIQLFRCCFSSLSPSEKKSLFALTTGICSLDLANGGFEEYCRTPK